MTTLKQLEHLRGKYNSQIRTIQLVLFVATAACVAAAASDVVDKDYANALGNFGLFAVLLRFYFVVPKIMAVAREGGMRWIKAEDNYLEENFPWYDWIGKIGWSCLVFSVGLQVIQVAGLLGI